MGVHVVEAGESLWAISAKYGVSLNTLVTVNGLVSAAEIIPGLALYIPEQKLPSRSYRVRRGDLLWRIAQRFNTTIPRIVASNPGLNPNRLQIGQILAIPSPNKLAIETLGFLVPSGTEADVALIESLANQLTYLAIVNYSFTTEGFAFAESDDSALVSRSRELNIVPLLMIRNFTSTGFSAELAGNVLGNTTFRQNLVASIANLAVSRGFGGVSLDLEFIPPERRTDFTVFLQALKRQLGGLILNVNVHAKTEDSPTNRIVGAYDYAAIGNAADLMALMTIDFGYPGGPPAPVSPINWVEQVVIYALTLVNPRKLLIAMPLYGYDKVVATNATKGISVLAAQNQAITTGASIRFDKTAQSPWYRYWAAAAEHIVWFEDIRSYIQKYNLLDRYNLAGTTYWQLSLPAPQNWAYLATDITVIKRGI